MLWPAERRLQAAVAATLSGPVRGPAVHEALAAPRSPGDAEADVDAASRDAAVMARAAQVALVLLVAGVVLMIAQP